MALTKENARRYADQGLSAKEISVKLKVSLATVENLLAGYTPQRLPEQTQTKEIAEAKANGWPLFTIRGKLCCARYFDALPTLSAEKYEALKSAIMTSGVIEKDITIDDAALPNILDGYHRARIWSEAPEDQKPVVGFKVRAGLDADAAYTLAYQLNTTGRILEPEDLRATAIKIKREKQWSNPRIAALLGVNQATVWKWLQGVELPATVVDARGRTQPTQQAPKVQPPVSSPAGEHSAAHQVQCARCKGWFAEEDLTHNDGAEFCETCFEADGAEKEAAAEVQPRTREQNQEWTNKLEESRQERHRAVAARATEAHSPDRLGPFSVLYVDPPWEYNTAGVSASRTITNHYPVLDHAALCSLPISKIAAPDCVLYLWTTAPHAEEAFAVLRAWGFSYKSQMIWNKKGGSPGLGHWARIDHELLYIATRGSFPTPPIAARTSSIVEAPRGRHSAKPKAVRDLLEACFPGHPKAELFARETAEGWTSIGNEIDGRDIREVLQ